MDELRRRRQQRDFEAASHTYTQLRMKHALSDSVESTRMNTACG